MQFHAIPCQIISYIQLICQLPTAINCCIKITCLWYVNRHDIVEWNCARGVTFFVLVISHYFIRWKIWNSVSRRIILLERLTERLQPLVNKFFFFVIICVVSLWDVNYGSKQNINTKPWMEKNLSCVLNGPYRECDHAYANRWYVSSVQSAKPIKLNKTVGKVPWNLNSRNLKSLIYWRGDTYFTHSGKWQRWIWPDHGRYVELKRMAFT